MTEFINAESGRINGSSSNSGIRVIESIDESTDLFSGRDKGKIAAKFPKRDLCPVPFFMEDIDLEELELGNDGIYSTIIEIPGFLDLCNKIPYHLPGSAFRQDTQRSKIVQICFDVGFIRTDRVVRQASGFKHLDKNSKIVYSGGFPL